MNTHRLAAGHCIGPFEVESALMEHPAVVEAGVIGIPAAQAAKLRSLDQWVAYCASVM
jgi:acyl-coenzyme A synthetase/AMP-(fatty) acid ligase